MTSRTHSIHRTALALLLCALLPAGVALGKEKKVPSDGTDDAGNERAGYQRDPFWPVGFVPEEIKKAIIEKENPESLKPTLSNDWNQAMKKLVINGVSSRSDNEFFAVINGEVKSEGDTVTVKHDGKTYTWAVDGIQPPGSVKLRRVSAL
jgi:hypothetical protein